MEVLYLSFKNFLNLFESLSYTERSSILWAIFYYFPTQGAGLEVAQLGLEPTLIGDARVAAGPHSCAFKTVRSRFAVRGAANH